MILNKPQDSGYYWIYEFNKKYIGYYDKQKETITLCVRTGYYYLEEFVNAKFVKIEEPNFNDD